MTVQLPEDLERYIRSRVLSGRFASHDDALTAAVRLLRQREEAEEARVLDGIRQGLDDMQAGRGKPADEVFAAIRRDFQIDPDA
ncbi:MAG TPA: type II toxin-antitoxin system ParD family antitoxin [Isosphaeraceae bacterium]|jgi:putative addiction module CopG family antidote|nr:type II toxin-antitoxin system ParD family antitoxin [Isosphaeraceae bacterium]